MSKQRRRRYDSEFKRRAVAFVLAGDKSVLQIATDLGIELSSLYRWKREYLAGHDEAPPDVSATATELDEELRRIRGELASVRTQRDVLKKALGIFSQTDNGGTNS